jgi:hypothetical protein
MNSLVPAPDVLGIPGPAWLFELLLHLTFVLHLVLMNFLVGGAVIAMIERGRAWRSGDEHATSESRALARWFEKKLPTAFALTVTFGVAPLLFVQTLYGQFFYSSSVVMGWPWLFLIVLLLVTYSLTYALSWKGQRFGGWQMIQSAKIVGGLALIAFVVSNNMGMAIRPDAWADKYFASPSGFHLNLDDPSFWPRLLHFMVAALAVTGMILANVGAKRIDRGQAEGKRWLELGALWYMIPTAFQIVTGLWWLISLPREVVMPLLGEDKAATVVFMISITLPLLSLVTMVFALRARRSFPLVHLSSWLLTLTIVGMVLTRDAVRRNSLAEHFSVDTWQVVPQWSLAAVFGILFVVSLVVVGWMARVYVRGGRN